MGKIPHFMVFRNSKNRKWFAIIMDVDCYKLGIDKTGKVDIINVKVESSKMLDGTIFTKGVLPAYHLNKSNWVSILLDDGADNVFRLIDDSYNIINKQALGHLKSQSELPNSVVKIPKYKWGDEAFNFNDEDL